MIQRKTFYALPLLTKKISMKIFFSLISIHLKQKSVNALVVALAAYLCLRYQF